MNDEKPQVVIYGTETCSYCAAARMLLKRKGVEYADIRVPRDDGARAEMERLSGRHTVPQIFIDHEPIGGFDDLYSLDRDGRLDAMLGKSGN